MPPLSLPQLPPSDHSAIASALSSIARGDLRFDRHDRMLYATDASLYQVEPIGVAIPADTDDAAAIASWCLDNRIALLPRGGGTSLAGQCTNHALVLDTSPNCRAVTSIDPAARTCTAEPGITIDELNDQLRAHNLFFAPDPATSRQATLGGCIGNNAAGARSITFGRTSENIQSLDVLLGTGDRLTLGPGAGRTNKAAHKLAIDVAAIVAAHADLIRQRFPTTIRRNAGYGLDMILAQLDAGTDPIDLDLTGLLCGSEGTLALTLGATLKLTPIPAAKGLAVVSFDSVEAAIDAVQPILTTGPSAVELLDDMVIDAALKNTECRVYVELLPKAGQSHPQAVLYVEYFADRNAAELTDKLESLKRVLGRANSQGIEFHTDQTGMLRAWKLRKAGEPLLHGLPGNRKPVTFVEDNAVPVENLSQFVRRFKQIVAKHSTKAAYWAHASVGVLHIRPMIDLEDDADLERMRTIAVEAADLARECGGIMSGEHGDGRVRGPLLERFFGPELMGAFRAIKQRFDPHNLLNPGNIVAPGPIDSITEQLRVKPNARVRVPEVDTYFTYDAEHGFDGAVTQCNGAGVCRKKAGSAGGGGTMCPSYHALLDERHSTRGRGNALRLAITGQLADTPGPKWDDPETIKTLDLCLSCKACKAECPSNVDIAKLKAEYTAQRYKQHGTPLAVQLMGRIRLLNRLGSKMPRLVNAMNRQPIVRSVLNRFFSFHPDRSLPEFNRSLYSWWKQHTKSRKQSESAKKIALFADCFTAYNEPAIGIASVRVLEHLGYEVVLVPAEGGGMEGRGGCCGRAMMSNGLLEMAQEEIERTAQMLAGVVEDPDIEAVCVCEPSCLSAFKDEWLTLKSAVSRELLETISSKSVAVEDFVGSKIDQVRGDDSEVAHDGRDAGKVLLHGHCHQKALWGTVLAKSALERVAGRGSVEELDTGCCGMAGGFGYGKDRYELSMQIGELSLLPAVCSASERNIVVAPGASCRHQIKDGCGVVAKHPIELIERILVLRDT